MHQIDIRSLDLNLLIALDVLLETRSVSAAAQRLGRTQSATSHTLQRLRDALGDPLLVRAGRGMVPTPRGEALAEPLRRTLDELQRVLGEEGGFEPATSRRSFTLAAPDVLAVFLPELMATLQAQAPGVRLALRHPLRDEPARELAGGRADLALAPRPEGGAGLVVRTLGQVSQCVLARRGHPVLDRPWTVQAWLAWPHVQVHTGDGQPSPIDQAIAERGLSRRIGLVVPGFLLAPHVVSRSDLLFAAPRELVGDLARRLDLVILPPPIPLPPVPVAATWHERHQSDPAHRWLRRLVIAEVQRFLLQVPGIPS